MEHDHLAQAERHIARGQELVLEQQRLIQRMAKDGHDVKMAQELLHTMLTTLERMHEHRDMIEAAIARKRR